VLCFLLSFLAVYDWLTLTNRLYHRASVLLALGVAVAFTRWVGSHQPQAVRFWEKSTPWLVAFFLLVFAGIQSGIWLHEQRAVANLPPTAPGSPNVLVIVIDTLRADHLFSYGYGRVTSPQLDQLAKNGVLFQNAVAPCSWTLPSHASADRTLSVRARLEECTTLAGVGPEESEWFRHTRRGTAAQRLSHWCIFCEPDFFYR